MASAETTVNPLPAQLDRIGDNEFDKWLRRNCALQLGVTFTDMRALGKRIRDLRLDELETIADAVIAEFIAQMVARRTACKAANRELPFRLEDPSAISV
jgi:hypothetical protein